MRRAWDRILRICMMGVVAGLWVSQSASAQVELPPKPAEEAMDPEQFRLALVAFTSYAGASAQTSSLLPDQIAALSAEEMQAVYDVFPNPRTFSALVDQLIAARKAEREGARDPNTDDGGTISGIVGVLPGIEPFEPDYPSSGLLDFLTSLGLASVEEDERCSDDDVEIFATAKIAAEIAAIVAQAACDHITVILGEGTNAPFCVAAGIANGVKAAAQVVLDACAELTRQVDSAEIEGAYENSLIIIEALACVNVDQARKVQGCNGQDDDCDGTIDECDEDTFGPHVFIDPSVQNACFASVEEAEEEIATATNANDDCGNIAPIDITVNGSECDTDATISVTDDCGNNTTLAQAVEFRIDGEPPDVSCSVLIDKLTPPNLASVDVGLSFNAVDNCPGDLAFDIKVTSDEQTTLPPGRGFASPFPDAAIMRTAEGAIVSVKLRAERGGGGDGRVYVIHVYATDQCGNVGKAECPVTVPPADDMPAVDSGQYFDATGIN